MASIVGFRRWDPSSTWGEVLFDDGTVSPIEDPDGSLEREANTLAQTGGGVVDQPATGVEQVLRGMGIQPKMRSPGAMRGASGTDPRMAQAPGGMSYGAPGALVPPTAGGEAPPEVAAARRVDAQVPIMDRVAPGMPGTPRAAEVAGRREQLASGAPGAPPAATPAEQALQQVTGQTPAQRTPESYLMAGQTPGRMMVTGSASSSTGVAPADAKRLRGLYAEAGQLEEKAIGQEVEAGRETYTQRMGEAQQAIVAADKQRTEFTAKKLREEAVREQVRERMQQVATRPLDPSRYAASRGTGFTIMAVVAGALAGALDARRGGNRTQMVIGTLEKLIDRDLKAQSEDRTAQYQMYERLLGDAGSAISALDRNIWESTAQYAEAQKKLDLSSEQLRNLDAIANHARARAKRAEAELEMKLTRTVTTQTSSQYMPGGVQVEFAMSPDDKLRFDAAGGQKALAALESAKLGGEGSTTVGATVADYQKLGATDAYLRAVAQAYGGTIPTTGFIDFNRSETLRNAGARLGFRGNVDASQANARIRGLITSVARQYGGPITEADVANAMAEVGTNTATILDGIQRTRQDMTNKLGLKAAGASLSGDGEILLRQLLARQEQASLGVPSTPSLQPR